MNSFEIKISQAQYDLFREALLQSERVGDCRVILRFSSPRIEFTDYEGVQATRRRLTGVRTVTAAAIRSWESIRRKIDEGVVSATREAA